MHHTEESPVMSSNGSDAPSTFEYTAVAPVTASPVTVVPVEESSEPSTFIKTAIDDTSEPPFTLAPITAVPESVNTELEPDSPAPSGSSLPSSEPSAHPSASQDETFSLAAEKKVYSYDLYADWDN